MHAVRPYSDLRAVPKPRGPLRYERSFALDDGAEYYASSFSWAESGTLWGSLWIERPTPDFVSVVESVGRDPDRISLVQQGREKEALPCACNAHTEADPRFGFLPVGCAAESKQISDTQERKNLHSSTDIDNAGGSGRGQVRAAARRVNSQRRE